MKRIAAFFAFVLVGLTLVGFGGCGGVPQAEYDEVVAERDQAVADFNTIQEENLKLLEEKRQLKVENGELRTKLGSYIVMDDFQTTEVSSGEVGDLLGKFFPNARRGYMGGLMLTSRDTVEEFLRKENSIPLSSIGYKDIPEICRTDDDLAFWLATQWGRAGLPEPSIVLIKKKERDLTYWNVIFIIKDNGEFAIYELVDFLSDELERVEGPMPNVYMCLIGGGRCLVGGGW
jgi:hypothetical protein